MCYQQRLRPDCAYAQSNQSLCLSLEYSLSVKLLTEHHLEFLSLIGGCTGSSEIALVKMSHCWKSHVTAQIIFDGTQNGHDLVTDKVSREIIQKCINQELWFLHSAYHLMVILTFT